MTNRHKFELSISEHSIGEGDHFYWATLTKRDFNDPEDLGVRKTFKTLLFAVDDPVLRARALDQILDDFSSSIIAKIHEDESNGVSPA